MKIIYRETIHDEKDIYYLLAVEHRSFEWTIKKRFSQFISLAHDINELYPDLKLPHLSRQVFNVQQDKRIVEIEGFLYFLVTNQTINVIKPVNEFVYSEIQYLFLSIPDQPKYIPNN